MSLTFRKIIFKMYSHRGGGPLLLLLVLALINTTLGCPAEVCICKWKGGKQTVECGGQQLETIPEGMDAGTQVLNFSGNSLKMLNNERFLRLDLLNLQKIYLSRNQLMRVYERAFRGLTNLVELDLSENALKHVPSETFQDYSSLMRLSLSGNPIRELKTSAFRHLSFLTTLELSNCQIEKVENEAFIGMDNLEWLRLDGNRIGFIQGTHILPKSLHGISLQANRWVCDCRLLDIHAWLINYNTPQTEEPKCVEPARLKGQVIKSLKKDELACPPEVSPESTYTEISEGRNMSLSCVVRAIPEPKVLWLFNGQVLTNDSFIDNMHMYYYIDDATTAEEKRSEIFIYNVGAEDNGTFSCVGMNIAGTTFSNYTLRVIIKEPPVVNEVSFPRDYMNYIIASSTGAGVIFVVLLCTIVVKCKQRDDTSKRKKCGNSNGNAVVTSIAGGSTSTDGNTNDTGMLKCASIITDGDSLNGGGGGLMLSESMTPTKMCKENGIILGGQMKQNLLLYAPSQIQQHQQHQSHQSHQQQQQQQMDSSQQSVQMNVGATPPPPLMVNTTSLGSTLAYCSPPTSVRNYQEKNPDLVNDAESVKNKLKNTTSLDMDIYDASSDCSGPCSIPALSSGPTVQYDNCYQLTSPQFGSQIMRPNLGNGSGVSRLTTMSTLPRGMQLKTVMQTINPQHSVDVHLNPVCFLGQDAFAYEYSTTQLPPPSHHHLQLQPQHSLGSASPVLASSNNMATPLMNQQPNQNFYRTLPHNRAHKQQQFAAGHNSGMRYSLEAELLQRSGTPTYEKYIPNVRFTAEGYPQQQMMGQQYPSPPEGYKSTNTGGPHQSENIDMPNNQQLQQQQQQQQQQHQQQQQQQQQHHQQQQQQPAFQQWPSCLPGYHAQPIHFPPTILGVNVINPGQQQQQQQQGQQPKPQNQQQPQQKSSNNQKQISANNNNNNNANNIGGNMPSSTDLRKRCMGTQADTSTIPEVDENDISPTASNIAVASTPSAASINAPNNAGAGVGAGASGGVGTSATNNIGLSDDVANTEKPSKVKHLNGPLADSPDEGYVGDSHENSDI